MAEITVISDEIQMHTVSINEDGEIKESLMAVKTGNRKTTDVMENSSQFSDKSVYSCQNKPNDEFVEINTGNTDLCKSILKSKTEIDMETNPSVKSCNVVSISDSNLVLSSCGTCDIMSQTIFHHQILSSDNQHNRVNDSKNIGSDETQLKDDKCSDTVIHKAVDYEIPGISNDGSPNTVSHSFVNHVILGVCNDNCPNTVCHKSIDSDIHGEYNDGSLNNATYSTSYDNSNILCTHEDSAGTITNTLTKIDACESKILYKDIECDKISYQNVADYQITFTENKISEIKKHEYDEQILSQDNLNKDITSCQNESLNDSATIFDACNDDYQNSTCTNEIVEHETPVISNAINTVNYRQVVKKKSLSSDESDSSSENEVLQLSDSDYDSDENANKKKAEADAARLMRTRGELGLENLPPIEDLKITVPEDLILEEIGQISCIVDVLVVVQARRNLPPLDADTILFLGGRIVLGQIFETFGPVVAPLYSVRFNNLSDIQKKNASVGAKVFYAPNYNDFTQYVFLETIRNQKGSDASWEHNNEPPAHCLEYSDDEEERRVKRLAKGQGHGHQLNGNQIEEGCEQQNSDKVWKNTRKVKNKCKRPLDETSSTVDNGPELHCWPPPRNSYQQGPRATNNRDSNKWNQQGQSSFDSRNEKGAHFTSHRPRQPFQHQERLPFEHNKKQSLQHYNRLSFQFGDAQSHSPNQISSNNPPPGPVPPSNSNSSQYYHPSFSGPPSFRNFNFSQPPPAVSFVNNTNVAFGGQGNFNNYQHSSFPAWGQNVGDGNQWPFSYPPPPPLPSPFSHPPFHSPTSRAPYHTNP